ncbi:serine/threonine protein kinase [Nocardia iowensis]|nr:protein kinase [Nocardia iowensis]
MNESFADYLIEGVLGRGGMGTVYLAQHPRLPRRVALKLLNREVSADLELRRRFEQEANVVARLDHPAIVGIHDRGTHDGHLWIAMQYIHGSDAARLNPREVPIDRALRIVSETGAALDYAHSRGVLHRDIKPANILLAAPDTGRAERAVLTDFGIARLLDSNTQLTVSGTFNATLAYASPEQLSGASVDHRSDQYSLACTLFTLLAGRPPYAATNPGQVIAGHISKPVPRLSTIRPDLPPALDDVIIRAMAKQRDERFGSCREFTSAAWDSRHVRPGAAHVLAAPTALNQNRQSRPTSAHAAAAVEHSAAAVAEHSPSTASQHSSSTAPPHTPSAAAKHSPSAAHQHTPAATPRRTPSAAPQHTPPAATPHPSSAVPPHTPSAAAQHSSSAADHRVTRAAPQPSSAPRHTPRPDQLPSTGRGNATAAGLFALLLSAVAAFVVAYPRAHHVRNLFRYMDPHIAPYAAAAVAAAFAALLLGGGALLLFARKRFGRVLLVLGCASYLASLVPVRYRYDTPDGTTGGAMAVGLTLVCLILLLVLSRPTTRWLRT